MVEWKTVTNNVYLDGLFKSPAFSQIVTTQGTGKTIYIGGRNAVNENAELVGKNDIAAQTEQVIKKLETALNLVLATSKIW